MVLRHPCLLFILEKENLKLEFLVDLLIHGAFVEKKILSLQKVALLLISILLISCWTHSLSDIWFSVDIL